MLPLRMGQVFLIWPVFSFTDVTDGSILLGRLVFTVMATGTTTFEFGDLNPTPTQSDFTGGGGVLHDLDPAFFGADRQRTYSVSIKAVSEPSTLPLAMTAAVFGVVFWRRRVECQ